MHANSVYFCKWFNCYYAHFSWFCLNLPCRVQNRIISIFGYLNRCDYAIIVTFHTNKLLYGVSLLRINRIQLPIIFKTNSLQKFRRFKSSFSTKYFDLYRLNYFSRKINFYTMYIIQFQVWKLLEHIQVQRYKKIGYTN